MRRGASGMPRHPGRAGLQRHDHVAERSPGSAKRERGFRRLAGEGPEENQIRCRARGDRSSILARRTRAEILEETTSCVMRICRDFSVWRTRPWRKGRWRMRTARPLVRAGARAAGAAWLCVLRDGAVCLLLLCGGIVVRFRRWPRFWRCASRSLDGARVRTGSTDLCSSPCPGGKAIASAARRWP